MTLPRLHQTLLSDILAELPEETAQLQSAVVGIATKYRTDLQAQLEQAHRFQDHVTRTHEKLHRKLKRSSRLVEENSRRVKVDVAGVESGRRLCDEVETLSKEVMGKLMGIVEILGEDGTKNIDGDKYPLLKKVMGQEGFEVVEIPHDDDDHDAAGEENETQAAGEQPLIKEHTTDTINPDPIVNDEPDTTDNVITDDITIDTNVPDTTATTTKDPVLEEETPITTIVPPPQSSSSTAESQGDELQSLESTLDKYQASKNQQQQLRTRTSPFPLAIQPSSISTTSLTQTISDTSITSVQGITYNPLTSSNNSNSQKSLMSLNESLRKLMSVD